MKKAKDKKLLNHANKVKREWIFVFEFIDFVHELIHISDVVITKWWPASILEILLCGKPPLIHTYLREQEKWNVEFVVENKVWVYNTNIKKLISEAKKILDGNLWEYEKNIKKLGLKIGTKEIGEELKKS